MRADPHAPQRYATYKRNSLYPKVTKVPNTRMTMDGQGQCEEQQNIVRYVNSPSVRLQPSENIALTSVSMNRLE